MDCLCVWVPVGVIGVGSGIEGVGEEKATNVAACSHHVVSVSLLVCVLPVV